MSKEISAFSISGQFQKGNLTPKKFGTSSLTIDVTGKNVKGFTQTVGTSDETVPLDDIGAPGLVWIKSNDPTNFVLCGADGTNYPHKVPPLGQIVTYWNGSAVHVKAVTAACDIEGVIIEA